MDSKKQFYENLAEAKSPKKQLTDALNDKFKRDHPNVPDFARPRNRLAKSPANQLTSDVMKFLRLQGHHVSRVNTMGVLREGKMTTGGGTLGAADLSVIMRNSRDVVIAWELEIKIGKDRLSEAQMAYSESVIKAGGHYSVVKTFDDFHIQYQKLYNS